MGRYRFLVDTSVALATFREEYGIPNDVLLELGAVETTPWGRLDQCPFTVLSITEGGLRFPVNPLLCVFLRRTGLAPTQVSTNTYRIINGIHELNNRLGTNLGLAEILRQYIIYPRAYRRRPCLLFKDQTGQREDSDQHPGQRLTRRRLLLGVWKL